MNPADRRKYARMPMDVPASLTDFRSGAWEGRTMDVSPFGVKVALPDADSSIKGGDSLRLKFAPADGGASISALVSVVRADAGSVAVAFVNLEMDAFRRLSALVDDWVKRNPRA